MGDDKSKGKFKQCLNDIVEADGGHLDRLDFDQAGRYGYAIVKWDTPAEKAKIVFDTGPVEVVDLAEAEELDKYLSRDP
jgi:hypothetical protein